MGVVCTIMVNCILSRSEHHYRGDLNIAYFLIDPLCIHLIGHLSRSSSIHVQFSGRFFSLSSRKIIIKGIRILPIKRLLSVYSTVERISIFKNRPSSIMIISKNVVHTSTLYKVRRGMRKPIKPAVLYCIWESCFERSISLWWLFSWRKHLSHKTIFKGDEV